MFKITKPGNYRTRDGRKAIVLAVDAKVKSECTVIGYIEDTCGETWKVNGRFCMDDEPVHYDIVAEWREPLEVDCYMIGLPHLNGEVVLDCRSFYSVEEAREYCKKMYKTAVVLRVNGREVV